MLEIFEPELRGLVFLKETFEIFDTELALWKGIFDWEEMKEEGKEANGIAGRLGEGMRAAIVTQLANRLGIKKGQKSKAKPSFRVFFESGSAEKNSLENLWLLSGLLADSLSRAPREIISFFKSQEDWPKIEEFLKKMALFGESAKLREMTEEKKVFSGVFSHWK